jgi:hypothetical protein
MFRLLLGAKADINLQDKTGQSSAELAVHSGERSIIELFIPCINVHFTNSKGKGGT